MVGFDASELVGRIRTYKYTQESLAEKIGISPCSLNLKLNGKRDFTQKEIFSICDALNIPEDQIFKYSFTRNLNFCKDK